MENAGIIQAIRNKIEQRKKSLRAGICDEEVFTRKQKNEMLVASEELDRLSRFLSTLELETNKDEKVPIRIYLGSKYEFIRRDIILKEIEGMKKNNEVSDNKEYASYELDVACGYDMACDDILSFLKAFAEADKHPKNILAPSKECDHGLREPLESEKPNQDELEKEIERCIIEPYYDLDGVAVKGATAYITVNDVADIARHFAEWGAEHAREQMMKDAVPFYEILKVVPPGPERDRVLLIVVKEGRL